MKKPTSPKSARAALALFADSGVWTTPKANILQDMKQALGALTYKGYIKVVKEETKDSLLWKTEYITYSLTEKGRDEIHAINAEVLEKQWKPTLGAWMK